MTGRKLRRSATIVLIAIVALQLLQGHDSAYGQAGTVIVTANKDTFVDNAFPEDAPGKNLQLQLSVWYDAQTGRREIILLEFSLPSLQGKYVVSMVLRLSVLSLSDPGKAVSIQVVKTGQFDPLTTSWNTMPPLGEEVGRFTLRDFGTVEIPLTGSITRQIQDGLSILDVAIVALTSTTLGNGIRGREPTPNPNDPENRYDPPQLALTVSDNSQLNLGTMLSPTTIIVVSSAIAFPLIVVSIVAYSRIPRRSKYQVKQIRKPFGSVMAITAGGMLLVASLWQLEIVDIVAIQNAKWCPPFFLWNCMDWPVARDIWYTGIFVAFALTLFGALKYATYKPVKEAREQTYQTRPWPNQLHTRMMGSLDERLYNYIVEHGGTISISNATGHLGVSVEDLKASIERLKQAGRIT